MIIFINPDMGRSKTPQGGPVSIIPDAGDEDFGTLLDGFVWAPVREENGGSLLDKKLPPDKFQRINLEHDPRRKVDLHGRTIEAANILIRDFVSRNRGNVVLLITGKDGGSEKINSLRASVIRLLDHLLHNERLILQWAGDRRSDGGAFRVEVKK